jgi:hypothetical protein
MAALICKNLLMVPLGPQVSDQRVDAVRSAAGRVKNP